MRRRKNQAGSAVVEFTLACIPTVFLILSVVSVSMTMFNYETLADAVKQAARFAAVHGQGCTQNGNSCTTTIGSIATVITNYDASIPANKVNVTFTSFSGAQTQCNPLSTCLTSSSQWPPTSNYDNVPGNTVTITASYPVPWVIAIFCPGSKPGDTFSAISLPASATEQILF